MRSIADIVKDINEAINIDEAKKFGLAQTYLRAKEKLPGTVTRDGKTEYVGFDDKYKISWYHKVNSLTTRVQANSGFGRTAGKQINSFAMSMIVFLNRKRLNKYADEIVALIQALTPETIKQSIRISFNTTILNDQQVYAQEYVSETYRLGPEHNLFQINYTLEVDLNKDCFNTCS